jgi:2,5-dihydroxypyridine 5,6-dioxygenase
MPKQFRLSHNVAPLLVPLFRKELALCGVKEGETILCYADSRADPFYPAAFMAAARELGAEAYQLTTGLPIAKGDIVPSEKVIEMMAMADMVLDLCSEAWLYTPETQAILKSGTRMLMCFEPEDVLHRLLPDQDLRRRSENGAQALEEAKEMRITTEAGTDLVMDLTGQPGRCRYGFTDTPGRWDHWPQGNCSIFPVRGTEEGTLVVNTGDVFLTNLGHHVSSPIVFKIREGRIVSIEGDGVDAKRVRWLFESFDDPYAYESSHKGWGTHKRSQWTRLNSRNGEDGGGMDAECFYGGVMMAFGGHPDIMGLPEVLRRKGERGHVDMICRGCSVYLDGKQIIDNERILPTDLK